jgi:hypothetical protein
MFGSATYLGANYIEAQTVYRDCAHRPCDQQGLERYRSSHPLKPKSPLLASHARREKWGTRISSSLQSKTFADQTLQPRLVEQIKGEFFIGEHGKRGFLRTGG